MGTLDWIILSGTLFFIVVYGVWKTRGSKDVNDYVRGAINQDGGLLVYPSWRPKQAQ